MSITYQAGRVLAKVRGSLDELSAQGLDVFGVVPIRRAGPGGPVTSMWPIAEWTKAGTTRTVTLRPNDGRAIDPSAEEARSFYVYEVTSAGMPRGVPAQHTRRRIPDEAHTRRALPSIGPRV